MSIFKGNSFLVSSQSNGLPSSTLAFYEETIPVDPASPDSPLGGGLGALWTLPPLVWGQEAAIDLVGQIVNYDTLHNRWLFSIQGGFGMAFPPGSPDPAIRFLTASIVGYADAESASAPLALLNLSIAIAMDTSGLTEDAVGWQNVPATRAV